MLDLLAALGRANGNVRTSLMLDADTVRWWQQAPVSPVVSTNRCIVAVPGSASSTSDAATTLDVERAALVPPPGTHRTGNDKSSPTMLTVALACTATAPATVAQTCNDLTLKNWLGEVLASTSRDSERFHVLSCEPSSKAA